MLKGIPKKRHGWLAEKRPWEAEWGSDTFNGAGGRETFFWGPTQLTLAFEEEKGQVVGVRVR